MNKIVTHSSGIKFSVRDSLEEHRAETLFTKEPETIYWIDSWVETEKKTFWDIGSNIGIYSLYAAIKYPQLQIISIEPFYKNFNQLLENIKVNKITNIFPLLAAVNNTTGCDHLFIKDQRFGASGSQFGTGLDEHGKTFDVIEQQPIFGISMDKLIGRLNLTVPSYLKIDVDGLEDKIIEGFTEHIKSPIIESVLIEVNGLDAKGEELKQKVIDAGFSTNNLYNQLEDHSTKRREKNSNNPARNIIFTR